MTSSPLLALATLVGAGITSAVILFTAQVPEGAKLTVTTHATVSPDPDAAWQAVRPPVPPELSEPEQATVAISPRSPLTAETSAPALDTGSLTRALQRELKSMGCYHGEINGVWTTPTRQAIKSFTDRANAKLPVTEPNQVLLALIKGNPHYACNEHLIEAAASKPTAKSPSVEPAPLLTPPMALAGPKKTETDGKIASLKELAPKTSGRRVVASSKRSDEHWSAQLWRNSGN